jgi:hypothetical protein
METAVVPLSENAIAAAKPDGAGARLTAMPARMLVSAAIGIVGLVAVLVTMAFMLRGNDHKVLFTQPQREGRRRGHRQARPDGRRLQVRRWRRHHPGAGLEGLRAAHEALGLGRQQGIDLRLRAARRQQQLRAERRPAARAAQACSRGGTDEHHPVAGQRAGGARDALDAAAKRLLPRAAQAHRQRHRAAAPRAHAGARADRRHRAPGGFQRARNSRPRPSACSTATARCCGRRRTATARPASTRHSCATSRRSRPAT